MVTTLSRSSSSPDRLRLRAQVELERRRRGIGRAGSLAQSNPLTFREFVSRIKPRYQWYEHVNRLAVVLQRVADGEIKRLMVFEPPRHGKSEEVSRLFSAYYLYRYPDRWVGLNSYAAELAFTLSRAARDNYLEGGGQVRADASAVNHWETGQGGGMWAAGVGGPITGKGFDLGIIDDSLKNAEEAASETIREKQKDWYKSTFYTREEPAGAIIAIQTRWHEDDLSGWLLSQEGEDEPERWHVVRFEAIKEDGETKIPPTCVLEPDWRLPGQALCPERYPVPKLNRIASRVGSYYWGALYQQRPSPRAGGMFKRAWFTIVDASPAEATRVRYWDKAGTEGGGAYTAGVLVAKVGQLFYVEDVLRGQWSSGQREAVVKQTAQLDYQRYGGNVEIWVEQEPGSGGKESAENTVSNLAGFPVRAEPVRGDKALRAEPFAAQAEVGNVRLLSADWNESYLSELTMFPNGKYKDQVDATSGAFNKLTAGSEVWFA